MTAPASLPFAQLAAYPQAPYSGYLLIPDDVDPIPIRGKIDPTSLLELQQLDPSHQLVNFRLHLKPLTAITSQQVGECLRLRGLRQDVMFHSAMLRALRQGKLPKALASEACIRYLQAQSYWVPGTLASELVKLTEPSAS